MEATLADGVVRAGAQARERFYDSRGYGRPVDAGDLELAPVEAAHLLERGDLDAVRVDGERHDFATFLASSAVSTVAYYVYADLRGRGFYLSPVDDAADSHDADGPASADFAVYPRGKGPWDDEVAYRVAAIGERESLPADSLGDVVLAVVDEESEITYLETTRVAVDGGTDHDLTSAEAELLDERVLCWDAPEALYERAFYGQRREDALQLSLVEAAYLAREGVLTVEGGADRITARGREVEGDRFDRRLTVYAALRDAGVVPKTGFKFGADFRTYATVESVADLGHSERLVRALTADHVFSPRALALDVRLAHGVRKEMVFALVDGDAVSWVGVTRLTP